MYLQFHRKPRRVAFFLRLQVANSQEVSQTCFIFTSSAGNLAGSLTDMLSCFDEKKDRQNDRQKDRQTRQTHR